MNRKIFLGAGKLKKTLFGIILTFSLIIGVNAPCNAFSIKVKLPGLGNIVHITSDIRNVANSMLACLRDVEELMHGQLNIMKFINDFLSLAGGSPLDSAVISAFPDTPLKFTTSQNLSNQSTTDTTNYATGNTSTLPNQINAYKQTQSSKKTNKKNNSNSNSQSESTTSSTSVSSQSTSSFKSKDQATAARNFSLNATGSNFGSAAPPPVHGAPEQQDLYAHSMHNTLAANQSIAIQGHAKAQSNMVSQNNSSSSSSSGGGSGTSSKENLNQLVLGPFGNKQFWSQVFSGNPAAIVTFIRGMINHYFSLGLFVFQVGDTISQLALQSTGILSMIVFIANVTIGSVTTTATAIEKSPIGKELKKVPYI